MPLKYQLYKKTKTHPHNFLPKQRHFGQFAQMLLFPTPITTLESKISFEFILYVMSMGKPYA